MFRRTENVVIEFCLPERTVSAIFVRKGGALFEGRDETKEIGLGRIPFGEEMKVIGHEAVGVKQERVTRRERNQAAQCHVAKRGVGEAWGPVVGTDRDEIDSITEVIRGTQADIFPVEWHAQESNKKSGLYEDCSAGLCPGLKGLPASFAGRARHGFFGTEQVEDS